MENGVTMDKEFNFIKRKHILIVDDERQLLDLIESILREDGFSSITTAGSAQEAIVACHTSFPDLAILDVNLPDRDGFSLMKDIRQIKDIPILFLTARDKPEDMFTGLDAGGDDYMTKPFLPKELLLRLSAILRRSYKNEKTVIELAHCTIDFDKAEINRQGETFPLTAREHAILNVLYKSANRIVTMDALCAEAWGDNLYGSENSLMAHIRRIREKIEMTPSSPESLITIKGLGYKLIL